MKAASPELKALLATGRFVKADCFTLTLVTGDVFRYTNAPIDITTVPVGGGAPVTYQSGGPMFDGLRYTASIGLKVDEQTCKVIARPTDLLFGIPFLTAMRYGFLDGARIHRDRHHAPTWADAMVGGVPMFYGRVSSIDELTPASASLKVKSDNILLTQQMPHGLYLPSCKNTLYDEMCTVNRAANTVSATVGASPTPSVIPWASANASFTLGVIKFIGGPNDGVRRSIRLATGSALLLAYPLNIAPDAGDSFEATRGCSRVYTDAANGCVFFNNQANFRGFPFLPPPESGI